MRENYNLVSLRYRIYSEIAQLEIKVYFE